MRKISETQSIPEAGITGTVGTTYDSDGNPASLTYPDGRVLNYTYSARSQLKTVTPAGAAAAATYTYDTAGRPTQVTKANGANTAYGYNPTTGDLTSVLTTKAGQAVDGVTYTLDPANGRRTGITRSSDATWADTYGYDPAGQVTSGDYVGNATLTDEDFVYDDTGNRTSHVQNGTATAYTPNALDQYSAIATLPQSHDLNGNMTSFTPPAAGASAITMAWDGGNQLIGASRAAEGATEARNVLYRYDALGRRILKQVFDPSTSPPTLKTATTFIYDGWNVVEERELTTSTKYRYTWGADVSGTHQRAGGVGGLLMAEATVGTGATEAHYYHYDGNGNVIALTNASGTREARYRYTAFGGNAYTEASPLSFGDKQPYRFSTKYLDREIEVREGMYYYGYRYYLTGIGRWGSRDPIGENGGINIYGMAGNDVNNNFDILGLSVHTGALAGNVTNKTDKEVTVRGDYTILRVSWIDGQESIYYPGRQGSYIPGEVFWRRGVKKLRSWDEIVNYTLKKNEDMSSAIRAGKTKMIDPDHIIDIKNVLGVYLSSNCEKKVDLHQEAGPNHPGKIGGNHKIVKQCECLRDKEEAQLGFPNLKDYVYIE